MNQICRKIVPRQTEYWPLRQKIEIVSFLSLVVEKVGEEVLVVDDHQNIQSVF